ncbi:MAG: apolipoprotein N-acyltransferase [Cyclobacteriaceae bacterium]|jgi:apolipoprotein N-acyltransferase
MTRPALIRRGIAALLAGAVFPLALAPIDWWPCAIISMAILSWLLRDAPLRAGLCLFYLYGVGFYGVGVSWVFVSIHEHGGASTLLAALLVTLFVLALALFFLLQGYVYLLWCRSLPFGLSLGFATAWVAREWLLTWFLTGFPWLFAGYGFLESPMAGYGPVLGVLGITFLVAWQATLLAGLVLERAGSSRFSFGRDKGIVMAGVLAMWLGGWALQQQSFVAPGPNTLRVSAVQGNIDQHSKWSRAMVGPIIKTYTDLSESEWQRDLVIWPEASVTVFREYADEFLDPIAERAQANGSALLLGIPDRDEQGRFLNSAIVVGAGEGRYVKRRLVPFGEYVPLESWLRGLIKVFDLPMSRNVSGPEDQPPLRVGDYLVSMSICYEVIYPELVRGSVVAPDLLVTISNDTWFGASLGPWQHLQMARMRALENGRYMVRATNNGVTAVIDEQGRVTGQLPQFETGVLRADVPVMLGTTPYARWGLGGLGILMSALWLGVVALTLSRRSR